MKLPVETTLSRVSSVLSVGLACMCAASGMAQNTCVRADDFALVRPGFINWHIDRLPGCVLENTTPFGLPGDRFLVGEPIAQYENGYDDLVVVRDANGDGCLEWFVKANDLQPGFSGDYFSSQLSNCAIGVPGFGLVGDIPLVGKFTSNSDQAAVKRGNLLIVDQNRDLIYESTIDRQLSWPVSVNYQAGERLLTADFFGHGIDDLVVWRPASRTWSVYFNSLPFGPGSTPGFTANFGLSGDIPCILDVNKDGHPDLGVWRPGVNTLFVNLWEASDPNYGYAHDDVDYSCNYSQYIPGGELWNVAAFGLDYDRTTINAPSVSSQPSSQTICSSGTAIFTVSASGEQPFSYAWRRNGVPITDGPTASGSFVSGATTSTLSISNSSPADAGTYSVLVSNSCGSIFSNGAALAVGSSPEILRNPFPSPQTLCFGGNASLSIIAESAIPMTYQWRRFGQQLNDGTTSTGSTVSGSQTAHLTITHVTYETGGAFDCVVTNACGVTVTSGTGSISICPSDFNCDGFISGEDFDLYVQAFESGSISADIDADGFITGIDFDLFVHAFEAGC